MEENNKSNVRASLTPTERDMRALELGMKKKDFAPLVRNKLNEPVSLAELSVAWRNSDFDSPKSTRIRAGLDEVFTELEDERKTTK